MTNNELTPEEEAKREADFQECLAEIIANEPAKQARWAEEAKQLRAPVPMPSRGELRKAMQTLDLAICAVEDDGPGEAVTGRQINSMREAYEVLDWFTR